MATSSETDSTQQTDVLYRFLKTLRGSFLLSMAAMCVVLFLVAVLFQSGITLTQQDGVIAGMLGVVSISGFLASGSFYLLLKLVQSN